MNARLTTALPGGSAAATYYVIIGCGFSGVLNHVLLHHPSNTRLSGLPVLQIGSQDPWRNYYPMPMGQWPTLLTLPGFSHQPAKIDRCVNLPADEFGDVNEKEWNALAGAHPFHHENAQVVAIRSTAPNRYEVVLDDTRIFQADYVDVCGGPGPARIPSASMGVDPVLMSEFHGSVGPAGFQRILSGETFLTRTTPAATSTLQICVYGGGPTGAWCVERAVALGHTVFWIAAEKLNSAFVASRRNDGLLRGPVVRHLVKGNHVILGNVHPSNPSTVFGENLEASAITQAPRGQVELHLKPAKSLTPRLTHVAGASAIPTFPHLRVDQVVLSIGQETGDKEPHSWATLLKAVFASAVHAGTHLTKDRQGRVVGVESLDRRVRLLGAAALSHPDVRAEWQRPGSPSNLFYRSLAEQARVPNGITLSALTIAEANGLWSGSINANLNTAGLADLLQLTAAWPTGIEGAQTWFEMRGSRIPPLELLEFQDFATRKVSY